MELNSRGLYLWMSGDSLEWIADIHHRLKCTPCRRCSLGRDSSVTDQLYLSHTWTASLGQQLGHSPVSTATAFCKAHHGINFRHKSSTFHLSGRDEVSTIGDSRRVNLLSHLYQVRRLSIGIVAVSFQESVDVVCASRPPDSISTV